MASYIDEVLGKLQQFEGSIPWMYLDTAGHVTVGTGLMLPSSVAANGLPFSIDDREATAAEIAAEFARVSAMAKGRVAKFYSRPGGLRLSQEAIENQLRGTLEGFEGYLRPHIRSYDALPDAAKMALLDMAYNLGPGRLFAEYPRLIAAVEMGDWKSAAAASTRRGPAPERNLWTRQQFLDAAKSAVTGIEAAAESLLTRWLLVGFGIGMTVLLAAALRQERRSE